MMPFKVSYLMGHLIYILSSSIINVVRVSLGIQQQLCAFFIAESDSVEEGSTLVSIH